MMEWSKKLGMPQVLPNIRGQKTVTWTTICLSDSYQKQSNDCLQLREELHSEALTNGEIKIL